MTSDFWELFKTALTESTKNIGEHYFEVKRYNSVSVQRERTYCYELYHQLRSQLGNEFHFTIHGEIDKRGQSLVTQRVKKYTNPDFVVHVPGGGLGGIPQLAVMEVKPSRELTMKKFNTDLDKLRVFIGKLGYQHGIFLIFGPDKPRASIYGFIRRLDISNKNIEIWWHKELNCPPEIFPATRSSR